MSNKRPTEKQFADAIKMLHTDVSGVQGLRIPEGKRWLNTIDEVDGIIRDYISEYMRRLSYLSDKYTWEYVGKYVDYQAGLINSLFLGYPNDDTVYERGLWNTPEQLGFFLRLYIRIGGELRFAVHDAIRQLTDTITNTYLAHQNEPISEWGWKIDALIEDLTLALLGIDSRDPELFEPDQPA